MARVRTILAIALVSALAACKPQAPADTTPPVFRAPPEYGLIFNDLGASVTLAFGAPDSDDVQLMMSCYKGSGRIMVSDLWQESAEVTVRSGEARMAYSGKVSSGEESPAEVGFWARPADPPLAAFRTSGELTLQSGIKVLPVKARPIEMAAVETFFKACERPAA